MRWHLVGALVASAALLAPTLDAQRRAASRGGLWFAGGLGGGWAHVSCDICRGQFDPGTSAFVRLGGTAGRRLLIGGEGAIWLPGRNPEDEADDITQNAWAVSVAAYWYPGRRRHLYLKGGIGYATHHVEDGTDIISSTGFGPHFGIGYEIALSRRWRIAPHFNAIVGAIGGGVKFNGSTAQETASVSLIQFGVGIISR